MTILADSACENIEASVVSCHVNWSLVGSIMVLFECLKRVVCHGVPLNPGIIIMSRITNSHSGVLNSPRELAQPNKLYTWTFKSTKKKLSGWNFERKSAQTVLKSCRHATLAHLDQTFGNQVTQEL
jgi:hypothetical protein